MDESNMPFVSLVVVGKNEEKHLTTCLSSLIDQDYHDFEIIYVDGGSTDSSLRIADSVKAGSSRMRIVRSEGNISESRNLGLSLTQGQIVAFTDADCVAERNWLRGSVAELMSCPKDVAGVGGPNVPPEESRSFRLRVIDQTLSTLLGSGASVQTKLAGSGKFVRALSTSNCAFWRGRLQEVGGFNSKLSFCEDSDLSARLRRRGLKLLWLPSHPVQHFRDYDGMKSFVSYIGRYGRGRGEAVRRVPRLMTTALALSLS